MLDTNIPIIGRKQQMPTQNLPTIYRDRRDAERTAAATRRETLKRWLDADGSSSEASTAVLLGYN